jgi:hypothetical protein
MYLALLHIKATISYEILEDGVLGVTKQMYKLFHCENEQK